MTGPRSGFNAFCAFVLLAAGACGGGGGGPPAGGGNGGGGSTPQTYTGIQRPGIWWDITADGPSFTALNVAQNYTYQGTIAAHASGFRKVTLTQSNDPGVTLPATGFEVDILGLAALAWFLGLGNDNFIYALGEAACVAAAHSVLALPGTSPADPSTDPFYGIIDLAGGATSDRLRTFWSQTDAVVGGLNVVETVACAGGTSTIGGETFTHASSGMIASWGGLWDGGYIGVPRGPGTDPFETFFAQSRELRGFRTDAAATVTPVYGHLAGGTLSLGPYANLDQNVEGTVDRTITGGAIVPNQLVDGGLYATALAIPGAGFEGVILALGVVGGKFVFLAGGQTGFGVPSHPVQYVLIEI